MRSVLILLVLTITLINNLRRERLVDTTMFLDCIVTVFFVVGYQTDYNFRVRFVISDGCDVIFCPKIVKIKYFEARLSGEALKKQRCHISSLSRIMYVEPGHSGELEF